MNTIVPKRLRFKFEKPILTFGEDIVYGILVELANIPEHMYDFFEPNLNERLIEEITLRKKAIEKIVKRYYECDVVFFN